MFFPKNYVNTLKALRTHCSLKILPDFELKWFENFVSSKKCIFLHFFPLFPKFSNFISD
eukprot:UN04540